MAPYWISHIFGWNCWNVDVALWRRPLKTWSEHLKSHFYRVQRQSYNHFWFRDRHTDLRSQLYQQIILLCLVGSARHYYVEIGSKILIIIGTNSKINARHLGFSVDSTAYKIADTIIKSLTMKTWGQPPEYRFHLLYNLRYFWGNLPPAPQIAYFVCRKSIAIGG